MDYRLELVQNAYTAALAAQREAMEGLFHSHGQDAIAAAEHNLTLANRRLQIATKLLDTTERAASRELVTA